MKENVSGCFFSEHSVQCVPQKVTSPNLLALASANMHRVAHN